MSKPKRPTYSCAYFGPMASSTRIETMFFDLVSAVLSRIGPSNLPS